MSEKQDEIALKCAAMKAKLNRFTMVDIVAIYYFEMHELYIQLVDRSGHIWSVTPFWHKEHPIVVESDKMCVDK